jgi:site-specific DNA-methyltransferase (adenine-specific)
LNPYYEANGISIYHGEALAVLQSLDTPVAAVLADPPYSSGGMLRGDRLGKSSDKYRGWSHSPTETHAPASLLPEFSGDTRDQRSYAYWSALWLSECLRLADPGALCFVFTDWRQLPTTTDALQAGGWVWRGIVVWDKGVARPIKGRFRTNTEYIVWGSNGPLPAHADVYPSSVIDCAPPVDRDHMTQKPEPLIRHLLSIAPPCGLVLDPFMGTGTTIVAARSLGHRAIGIEIEERYCEIAAKRLDQMPLFPTATPSTPVEQADLFSEAVS